jgi:hypothetical protein
MLNPRNQRHQKRTRIGQSSQIRMTLQGDQSNPKGPRMRIKTRQQIELRLQNLHQERLQKIKTRTRTVTNHQVKIKIKLLPKTLLRRLHHLQRKVHQPRSLLVMIIIMLPQKMPKAFGRHLRSQRQRLMLQLQRIRAGNLDNQKKIKTRIRETLKREALSRRGDQISLRQSPRPEMKGIKLQQMHLMLEFHQMDVQAMTMEMIVQPKRAMKEIWTRTRSLLQLGRERNQRSTSHLTMWMFLVSKLCGSSSHHDAAIPGISRPSPG